MSTNRWKDHTWNMCVDQNGNASFDAAQLAVLMDIRDELKRMNSLLWCRNFTGIPQTLKAIERQTKKRKHRKKVSR